METSDSEDDVHQCGRCKQLFHSIDDYFVHKKSKSCVKVKSSTKDFIEETQLKDAQEKEKLVSKNSLVNEESPVSKESEASKKSPITKDSPLNKESPPPAAPVRGRGKGRGRGRGRGAKEGQGKGKGRGSKTDKATEDSQLEVTTLDVTSSKPDVKCGESLKLDTGKEIQIGESSQESSYTDSFLSNVDFTQIQRESYVPKDNTLRGEVLGTISFISGAADPDQNLLNTSSDLVESGFDNDQIIIAPLASTGQVTKVKTNETLTTVGELTELTVSKKSDQTPPVYGRGWRKAAPKKAWVEDYHGKKEFTTDPPMKLEPPKQLVVSPQPIIVKECEVKQEVVRRKRGRPRKYPIRDIVENRKKHHPSAEGGPWQCPQCQYIGEFRDEYDRHLRRVHNLSNWVCKTCGQAFRDKYKLQRHQAAAECKPIDVNWIGGFASGFVEFPRRPSRSVEGLPECKVEALENVMEEDGQDIKKLKPCPDADFSCYICSDRLGSYEGIMSHMKVHKDVVPGICRFCGKWFKTKYKVWRHMSSSVHDDINEKDIQRAKAELAGLKINWKQEQQSFSYPRTYDCQVCKKRFSTKVMYEKHMNRFHNAEQEGSGGRFKCESCDKWFNKRKKYQNHLFYDHGIDDDNIKNFKCPVCERVFTQKTHVFRHFDTLHTPAQQLPLEEMEKDEVFAQNRGVGGKNDNHRYKCFVCKKILIGFTVYYRHVYNHKIWAVNTQNGPNPSQQLLNKLYESLSTYAMHNKILTNINLEKKKLHDEGGQSAENDTELQPPGASSALSTIDQSFGDLVQQQGLFSFLQDVGNQLNLTTGMSQDQPISQGLQLSQQQLPLQTQDQTALQHSSYHELGQPLQPLLESLPQGEKIPTQSVVHHHPQPNQTPIQPLHQQQVLSHQNLLSQQPLSLTTQQSRSNTPKITTSLSLGTHGNVVSLEAAPSTSKLDAMGIVSNQGTLAEGLKTALDISHQIVSGPTTNLPGDLTLQSEEPMVCVTNDDSQDRVEDKKFLCVFCNQNQSSLRALYEHKMSDHNLVSVFCCVKSNCQNIFHKVLDYEAHAKVHSQECFICYACNYHFEDMNDLIAHKTSCHRGLNLTETVKCNVCHKAFNSKENLAIHMAKGEHHFQCTECGKVLGSQALLKDHEAEHQGLENFLCDICGATFNSKGQLYRHRSTNHGGKMHKCTMCESEFCKKEHLKRHLQSKHSNDKPFVCHFTDCGKSFKRKDKLQEHYRSHCVSKPYICKQCGKSYRYREGLRYHEKTHTKDAKYFCNLCQEGFVRPSLLRLHMKDRHEVELKATHSYPCKFCTTVFARPERLKRHMEKAHRVNAGWKFNCKSCNKGFAGERSLLTHMKRSHGTTVVKRKPAAKSKDETVTDQSAAQVTITDVTFTRMDTTQPQQVPKLITIEDMTQTQQLVNTKQSVLPIVHPISAQPATSLPVGSMSMSVPAASHQVQVQVPTLIRSVPTQVAALQPSVSHSPMLPTSAAITVTTSAAPMLITHPSLLQPIQITAYQPPNMTMSMSHNQQLRPTTILNTANTLNPQVPGAIVSQNPQIISPTPPVVAAASSSTQLQLQPMTRMVVSATQSQGEISVLTAPLQPQPHHSQQINPLPFTQLATYATQFNNTYNYNQVFQTPLSQTNQLLQQHQHQQQQQQQQQLQLHQQVGHLGGRT